MSGENINKLIILLNIEFFLKQFLLKLIAILHCIILGIEILKTELLQDLNRLMFKVNFSAKKQVYY